MSSESARIDEWFSRLNAFHKLVRFQQRLLQARALVYGGLILSICNLLFMLYMAPRSGFLISLPLVFLPLLVLAAPLISVLLRVVEKKRNTLARAFFTAGFRVDAAGRLITNAAHPEVIAEPGKVLIRPRLAA